MLVKVWSTCPRGRAFFSFSSPVIFRRRDVERARVWMRAERTRAKDVERFDARRECSVREGWTLNGEMKKIKKKKRKKLERGEEKEAFNRIAPLVYRQNATLSKDVQSEKDREEKKIILTRTWNRKGVVPWSGETESRWERQARKTRLVIHNPPPVEKILSVSRVSSPD